MSHSSTVDGLYVYYSHFEPGPVASRHIAEAKSTAPLWDLAARKGAAKRHSRTISEMSRAASACPMSASNITNNTISAGIRSSVLDARTNKQLGNGKSHDLATFLYDESMNRVILCKFLCLNAHKSHPQNVCLV